MSTNVARCLVTGVAVTALAMVTSLLPMGATEAANCKQTMVQATAKGYSKPATIKKAWGNWQNKVWKQYGLNWSVPEHATSKSESCSGLTCVVKGRPCFHMPQ
jgi:hypothetical protein